MDTQKQQVAQRVKEANNILVTVSNNPSVDQLAACIGLTLALNKMGKHATAVFSGDVPSTIEFLQPEKTIEKNTDSLRDFIIALDKSKADKLRYKVEDRVVKIFITPYKTSISDKDLEFSQGDFNVDVVLALGVHAQADLDQAITSHGRILHDATVVTMNVRPGGELGSMNWLDPNASSLSELTVQLVDMLDKKLLDGQIATAMLTGIVAETERFSNAKTSPQTMSISAELMAVGANQQLVATKLEEPVTPPPLPASPIAQQDAHTDDGKDIPPETKKPDDGTLEISHDEKAGSGVSPETKEAKEETAPEDSEPPIGQPESAHEPENSASESHPEAPAEPEHKTPMIHDVKSDHTGLLPAPKAHGEDENDKEHEAHDNRDQEEPEQPAPPEEPKPTFPEGELPLPQPPAEPVVPPQIHIDEHGALSPVAAQEPDEADEALLPPAKPQEPPTISHHNEAPKMVLEPPTLGGQLSANTKTDSFGTSGNDNEDTAVAGMPANNVPMLGSGQGLPGSTAASQPADFSGTLPSVTAQPVPVPNSAAQPQPGEPDNAPGTSFLGDQPLNEEPSTPKVPAPDETLSDIERDVHSTHLGAGPAPAQAPFPDVTQPTSQTEPAYIQTPLPGTPPQSTAPAPAASPFAPDPLAGVSAPAPAMPDAPAPAAPVMASPPPSFTPPGPSAAPQIPVMEPDDLTPEEVAQAFGTGGDKGAQNPAPAPSAADNSVNTTPTFPEASGLNPSTDLTSARDAVAQAISGNANPPLEPVEALNANPLNLPLGNEAAGQTTPASVVPPAPGVGPVEPVAQTAPPPVQPWTPPTDTAPARAGVPNPATQFNPAAFGQDDPDTPPPGPPPMMPQMPAA